MSLRIRILKRLCALNGHQSMGRTAVPQPDGRVALICNQCGAETEETRR